MNNPECFIIYPVAFYFFIWFLFSFFIFVYTITQIRKNGTKQAIENIFGRTWGKEYTDGLAILMEIVSFGAFWPIVSINFIINKLFVVNSPKG